MGDSEVLHRKTKQKKKKPNKVYCRKSLTILWIIMN